MAGRFRRQVQNGHWTPLSADCSKPADETLPKPVKLRRERGRSRWKPYFRPESQEKAAYFSPAAQIFYRREPREELILHPEDDPVTVFSAFSAADLSDLSG